MLNYLVHLDPKFKEQFSNLSEKARNILKEKIKLTIKNPGRNKTLKGFPKNTFRIRFKDKNKEKRAIYILEGNKIYFNKIIDRKKDYKDLY